MKQTGCSLGQWSHTDYRMMVVYCLASQNATNQSPEIMVNAF